MADLGIAEESDRDWEGRFRTGGPTSRKAADLCRPPLPALSSQNSIPIDQAGRRRESRGSGSVTGTIPSHSMYLTYFIKKYKYLQVVRAVLSTEDLVGWNLVDTGG